MTEKTKNVLSAENLAKTKKGVRIITAPVAASLTRWPCARRWTAANVDGAGLRRVHGGAGGIQPAVRPSQRGLHPASGRATTEAQENVALQVAEQMSDYLLAGAISNAVNFPSITAEEAPKLRPFIELAEKLGSFAGQLTDTDIKTIRITYMWAKWPS